MSQMYQIPEGDHHPDRQVNSARDEIRDIFQQVDDTGRNERVTDGVVEEIYSIGKSIAAARKYRLDSILLQKTESHVRFISSASKLLFGREVSSNRLDDITEADLRNQEGLIGSKMFHGRALTGGLEEHLTLFNYDPNNWYFHQVVTDRQNRTSAEVTLHYEITSGGVLRISTRPDTPNEFIVGEELDNFARATETYHHRVMRELYAGFGAVPSPLTKPPVNGRSDIITQLPIKPVTNNDSEDRQAA